MPNAKAQWMERIRALSQPLNPMPTEVPARLVVIEPVETVLFDIYGTLLISGSGDVGTAAARDSAAAMRAALEAAGCTGDLEAAGAAGPELMRTLIEQAHAQARQEGIEYPEVSILEIWRTLVEQLRKQAVLCTGPESLDRLALEYECRVNPVWPMPGARETLTALKERGLRMGIVSNAQFYTPLILEALFDQSLDPLGFDPALCVWSFKERRAKPDPLLFQRLEGKINPARTLYIGNDMLNDIHTARQAGCRTALFASDRRSLRLRENDSRCHETVPDAVITELPQLFDLIGA